MTGVRNEFRTAIADFGVAVRGIDPGKMQRAHGELGQQFTIASPEDHVYGGPELARLLNDVPFSARGAVAVMIGACVESGADPVACAPKVLANLARNLEHGLEFVRTWQTEAAEHDLPDPTQPPPIPFEDLTDAIDSDAVFAWWGLPNWELAGLAMLQRPEVRRRLGPIRQLLRERYDAFSEVSGRWDKCVDYVLKVLDDEPLVVLHRETGTGYRLRMSGMGDNFQLHTLLADALIGGGHLPGEAPQPEAVAACIDAEGMVPSYGAFNFVSPDGSWIWNEGTPWDIPVIDGVRLLVLDPEPYRRTWPAGRFFPYMPGELVFERTLSEQEAAAWFAHVRPARTPGGDPEDSD
ncbi:hypothetical protein ACFVMC_24665 [Nocardia sp. NPDC127579]|uniref:hypothetical protein n=1 Tax=Nocardia sp. NPDC127579 TaxID=3345402 RepID=UPI00363B0BE1